MWWLAFWPAAIVLVLAVWHVFVAPHLNTRRDRRTEG